MLAHNILVELHKLVDRSLLERTILYNGQSSSVVYITDGGHVEASSYTRARAKCLPSFDSLSVGRVLVCCGGSGTTVYMAKVMGTNLYITRTALWYCRCAVFEKHPTSLSCMYHNECTLSPSGHGRASLSCSGAPKQANKPKISTNTNQVRK